MDKPLVKLDIISDPICPWCCIGKANLDAALAQRPDHPFVIEWHPFQLNPDMPLEGMDRGTYLDTKFNTKDGGKSVNVPILEAAKRAGIVMNMNDIKRTPNTMNAHRLLHWAGIEALQLEAADAIFEANFVQARDIGDTDVLVDIAEQIGMDGAAVRVLLDGDADVEMIAARDKHARTHGVTGVPTFIVAQQHALSGAQPTETWLAIIDDLTAQLSRDTGADAQ